MTTTDVPLPGYTPASGGETPPPEGMRGEVADNPDTDRPDLRREVRLDEARSVLVEDSSGTAFAEASGAAGLVTPPPSPVEQPSQQRSATPTLAMFAAAFVSGVLLATLTGSTRRRAEEPGRPAAG